MRTAIGALLLPWPPRPPSRFALPPSRFALRRTGRRTGRTRQVAQDYASRSSLAVEGVAGIGAAASEVGDPRFRRDRREAARGIATPSGSTPGNRYRGLVDQGAGGSSRGPCRDERHGYDLRVLQPFARDPAYYASIVSEESDTPSKEGPVIHGAIRLFDYPVWPRTTTRRGVGAIARTGQ